MNGRRPIVFRKISVCFMRHVAMLAFIGATAGATAADDLREFRALVQKLIVLQETRYRAQAEWDDMRPIVEGRVDLLQQRRKKAGEALEKARGDEGKLRREQEQAERTRSLEHDALMGLAGPVIQAEQRLRGLAPALPVPLLDLIRDQVQDLPDPSAPIGPDELPDRLRFVFGVLTEVQQFANNVHLVRQRLRDPDGNMREMEVLYLGLGVAFAVSSADTLAASGHPGPDGWTWVWAADIAEDVRTAVQVFRKERPARFVDLPLRLVGDAEGRE